MPRLPRKPSAPRPRGAVGAMAAGFARRKAAREPRVVVTDPGGQPRTLAADDPAAAAAAGGRRTSDFRRAASFPALIGVPEIPQIAGKRPNLALERPMPLLSSRRHPDPAECRGNKEES